MATAQLSGALPQPTVSDIVRSAAWYLWQVRVDGLAEFVPMSAESYRESSFLDQRIVRAVEGAAFVCNIAEFRSCFQNLSDNDNRFIFHISHVGSTLLSKILGTKPDLLSLREPVILRWMADIRRDLGRPESRYTLAGYEELLRIALGMLARPLDGMSSSVVKATSYASILAEDILTLQPQSSALGLYCRFESFAATVLKGSGGWMDMLHQAPVRLRRLNGIVGQPRWQLASMSAGEIVAANWLAEMVVLARAAQRHSGRFRLLDFDEFIAQPFEGAGRAAALLRLDWSEDDRQRLAASGVLGKYSKSSDAAYSAEDRRRENELVAQSHAAEIKKGKDWLHKAIEINELTSLVKPFI